MEAARRAAGSLNAYPDPELVREVEELYASYAKVDPGLVKALPGSDSALEVVSRVEDGNRCCLAARRIARHCI